MNFYKGCPNRLAVNFALPGHLKSGSASANDVRCWPHRDFLRPNSTLLLICLAMCLVGCASQPASHRDAAERLQTIRIQDEKVSGSPKQLVKQLNKLAKKYDLPLHEGVAIHFDPAVDNECCDLTMFRKGEPLANWLQDVCKSCGSKYRVVGGKIQIGLLPISEKQTPNLESSLTNGLAQLCQQFRSKRGRDRYELGEELFELLPHSPVTWSKEAPMHLYVSYDSEHPNYKLYKRDVLALLGEPDRNENNQKFYYSLTPRGDLKWELGVEFGEHDYVEDPSLAGH
jgi:hypothetical protein